MRFCHVTTEVAGFRGGGIGTYVVESARALRAAGHEVWLVTWDPGGARRAALTGHDAFDRVLLVDDLDDGGADHRFALAREAYRFSHLAHRALAGAGVDFDWIEFPDYEAAGYVSLLEHEFFDAWPEAVLAVHLHSPTWECEQYNLQLHHLSPTKRELCALEEDAIRRAPLRLCPSQRLREMVSQRLGLRIAATEIVRYPMALGAAATPSPRPRRRLDELRFAYYGRLEPRKGVHTLVEAFASLPECRLELIGDDRPSSPLGTSVLDWLRRHATPNVTFRPGMPRERLLRELDGIDVCIFPSLWENWPNVCIEAMAAGRVVLGARNGGMAEMIEPGVSGFVVDGSDPADIVRVIRDELGGALDRLDAIGAAAARRIRALSEPAVYVARVEQLAAAHRERRRPVRPAPAGRVSVIVPFHGEDLAIVGAAVDSALAQTWPDLDVLVVDDGSPRPDAAAIRAALAAKDPRVTVLQKPNGGLASARNHAIARATGDFLLFLDADNLLRPDYARTALQVFARAPDAVAAVPEMRKFDDATGRPILVSNPLPFIRALAYFRNGSGDAGAMWRASAFREHRLAFDPEVDAYSDWALWLDCARLGLRVQPVPRVLYDYRVHPASMMARGGYDRHLALLGLLIDRHWIPGSDAECRDTVAALAQGFGLGAILSALGGRAEAWERPAWLARRLRPDAVRYRLADLCGGLLDRVPALRRALRAPLAWAIQRHGRWKDRRRRMQR